MQRRHFDPTYELDADRREAVRRHLMAPLDGDDRMQAPLGGQDHRAASPSGPPWTHNFHARRPG